MKECTLYVNDRRDTGSYAECRDFLRDEGGDERPQTSERVGNHIKNQKIRTAALTVLMILLGTGLGFSQTSPFGFKRHTSGTSTQSSSVEGTPSPKDEEPERIIDSDDANTNMSAAEKDYGQRNGKLFSIKKDANTNMSAVEKDYGQRNGKLFPIKKQGDMSRFYGEQDDGRTDRFLRNSTVTFTTEEGKASVFNEIYSDYLGHFRLGVGLLLSNVDSNQPDSASIQNDAFQMLLGGGGNIVLDLGYPLFYRENKSGTLSFRLFTGPKVALDIPKVGTASKDFATNVDLGLQGSLFVKGAGGVLDVYGNFRIGGLHGNSLFYTNIHKGDSNPFFFNQASVGLVLVSKFTVGYSFYWGSSFVRNNFPQSISVSFVP